MRFCSLLLCLLTVAAAKGDELLSALPRETDAVVVVHVRQFLETPLGKKHSTELIDALMSISKDVAASVKASGIDPSVDFDDAVIGLQVEKIKEPGFFLIARGTKFEPKKLGDHMARTPEKFTAERVNGHLLYRMTAAGLPGTVYTTLIEPDVVVMGNRKDDVAAAGSAMKGKVMLRDELMALFPSLDPHAALLAVAQTRGKMKDLHLPENLQRSVDQVDTLTIEIGANEDLGLRILLHADSPETAAQLTPIVSGGFELLKLQLKLAAGSNPELKSLVEMLSTVKAVQKGSTIGVNGTIRGPQVDDLLKARLKK